MTFYPGVLWDEELATYVGRVRLALVRAAENVERSVVLDRAGALVDVDAS